MSDGFKGWLLLTGGAMVSLLIVATVYQYRIDRKASTWSKAQGRIRSSRVVSRKIRKVGDQGSELRNFAEITYDYDVDGKKLRGTRVHLGADLGNYEVAETVARYPQGMDVIVYYDPAKPSDATLQRNAPEGIYRTIAIFILGFIGALLALAFGTEPLFDAIATHIPKPGNIWAVALFGGAGGFLALMALAFKRELAATQNWSSTWGRIEGIGVEQFKSSPTGEGRRRDRYYAPLIAYTYTVDGQRYTGSRIRFGGYAFLSLDFWAKRQAAAYTIGAPVTVYFDPKNPTSAVLERRAAGIGWLWLIAIILLGLAARAAGFI